MEKQITYTASNTYETLNSLTQKTKNVWLVFHGIGYLSRFFIKSFSSLNKEENYIICPQAPAKYYKDPNYKQVGASWLTKENTKIDTENVLNYIDSIIKNENIEDQNLIVLGYSQGVSIAARWIAKRKKICKHLLLMSGQFPAELKKEDFNHLKALNVIHTVGEKDPLFDPKNVRAQENYILDFFSNSKIVNHDGGHEISAKIIKKLYEEMNL